MFEHFVLRHIPPLLVATITTFGGTMPLFNPEGALKEFGFPERIVASKAARPVMVTQSARTSCLGLGLLLLYANNQLAAMDIVFASMGWIGLIDWYVLWKEGLPGQAAFRAISTGLIAGWGLLGMTAGR